MHSVHQDASFELSKCTIKQFFHLKGRHFLFKGGQNIFLDMLDLIDETRLVLKSLGKMLFKNSPRKLLACILAVAPLPIMKGLVKDLAESFIRKGFKKMKKVNRRKIGGWFTFLLCFLCVSFTTCF